VGHRLAFDFIWRAVFLGALLAFACVHPGALAQQIYRSVDADGHVVYSDRGSSKEAPKTTIKVVEPDPAEVARLAKQQELLKVQEAQRQKQQVVDDKSKASQDKERDTRCQQARNRYYQMKDSGRLFQRDADGNRIYYSDEEADKVREDAKRTMTALCGS